jgi:adenosylmethionine---8-amino-7-oxononanoate aminotransferase
MKNASLSERDHQVIWHPYTQHKSFEGSLPIVRGEGALLFDENGNTYIDAISSWWVTLHGHAHPYLAERVYRQALQLEQVIFTHFTHEPAVLLAERLLRMLPGGLSRIFYSDNGSTAVEVAIKMAIQFWKNKGLPKKRKILAIENAYHGDTFGAMSVSSRGLFTDAFRDLLFDVIFIDTPDETSSDKMKSILQIHEGEIAAFIYEPLLQAAGGMKMYRADHMNDLLEMLQKQEILCIADEVLTGFGRTGKLFASENIQPAPDLICLSKGLTGGMMALGATACSRKIFDAFLSDDRSRTFFHGHSYTANPLACTAGLASLDLLEDQKCREQINAIQEQHEEFVKNNLQDEKQNLFRNVRIQGTILAFEINTGKDEYINQVGTTIMEKALSQGIYLRPLGNTVYVMPPYCITQEQLEKIYQFLLSI